MNDSRHYYRDADCRTFRVVQRLTDASFVVVKVFADGSATTVKFWEGSLEVTADHWTTKEFIPTAQGRHLLDLEFEYAISRFAPLFQLATACTSSSH